MYHIFAMNVTMSGMLYKGGKLVTLPMFEPKMFLETMLTYRPTSLHLAPPLISFLVHHPAVSQDHLASLKNVRPPSLISPSHAQHCSGSGGRGSHGTDNDRLVPGEVSPREVRRGVDLS